MKYIVFFACLSLSLALNENNPINTKTRRNILDGISTNDFGSVSFESITIRSNIAPDSIIPSLPARSNFGSPITPDSTPFLYSAESLGGIQNHYATLGDQHKLLTIPVKSSDAINGFQPIINSNSPFGASLEIKTLNQNDAFRDFLSVKSASHPGTIPQNHLGYDNIKNLKASSISEASSIGKIGQQNTLSRVSASIEKVPEVASFFKTGPLVPSDIPSVAELNKIFDLSEKSNDKFKDLLNVRSGSASKVEDSNASNSNLQTNIISNEISSHQDRVATSNQEISGLPQLEQTSNEKNKSGSFVQSNDSVSSNSEPIVNVLENSQGNTTLRLSDEINEKEEVNTDSLNQTIISNSTIPVETTTILQEILSENKNVSTSQPIRKFDANSFSNVSDILKETSEINTTSQAEPVLLARIEISEPFNITSNENKNETSPVEIEEDLKVISITDDKEQSNGTTTEVPKNQTSIIESLSNENSTVTDSLIDGSNSISVSAKEDSVEPTTSKSEIELRFNNEPESNVNENSTDEKKAEGKIEVIKSCGCGKAKHNVSEASPSL